MMPDRLNAKRSLHVLLPLFIGSVIAYLDRVNLSYANLTMSKELGFSPEVFGAGAGIFFVGYILFEVPGALVAERWSARVWLTRIMVTWGLVSAFMAFVHVAWQFYLVRFLLGAAEASFYPVAYATVIPRWFAPEERPRALAVTLTSLPVASIIGAPFAGWLLGTSVAGLHGWQVLFLVEAIPALLFGVILYCWLADWPAQVGWLTDHEKRLLADQYARDVERKLSVHSYTVLQAFRDPQVLRLCAIYLLWITGFWAYGYWTPTVVKEVSGWSTVAVGWAIVVPMALALAAMLYVGASASRTGEQRLHGAIPMFLGALGMGVGALSRDPVLSFACVCVAGIGVYAAFGVWWSYPTSFLSGTAAAGAVGLINSFGNMGGYVGPYITGWIKVQTGSFHWAYVVLSGSLLAAGLLMLTLPRTRAKAETAT